MLTWAPAEWGMSTENMSIQSNISLSERPSETGLVPVYVVCVCCACGAAFTETYRGFAYSAKSWHSYLSHFVIFKIVIADFQSHLFSSAIETFFFFLTVSWLWFPFQTYISPTSTSTHNKYPREYKNTHRQRNTHPYALCSCQDLGEIIEFNGSYYRSHNVQGTCNMPIILLLYVTILHPSQHQQALCIFRFFQKVSSWADNVVLLAKNTSDVSLRLFRASVKRINVFLFSSLSAF